MKPGCLRIYGLDSRNILTMHDEYKIYKNIRNILNIGNKEWDMRR